MEEVMQRKDLFKAQEEDRRRGKDGRRPDWRFGLLAEFELMLKEYGQDHVSHLN